MEPTLMLELSAVIAVTFEVIKRFIQSSFSPKNADYVFRLFVIAISFGVAAAYKFYFSGHPEIVKNATQLTVQASGIWALVIKLLPAPKKKDVVLKTQ